ncbi:MAG: cyclic lactone autoinducer peptide [Longibaculum muris]|uniref:Cyclic lactone autoinducer peptide n=1 Tax=Longibaculum muris TaxID=1796628 RepID=A0A4R3YHN7_9FIRM|nr:cyclic lactone autoinducer peptide [Longibaculum muris]KXU43981.1 hypothetical protein HMPREF3037_02669 [Candidatus Stoquefichus sp. KLE1796]MBS5369067.1 cyclic lactone autoinducer peptide [Coprobacillus cateniformis]MCR1889226.1 cyclic lactone autoinducer peptide [Longibaculum muris]MED9813424.1 cyclic lactone autoinducer peptide [Longibaculum muris]TCV91736.1 cyclic lactone autoinducer peptide [Longibaculum muris]
MKKLLITFFLKVVSFMAISGAHSISVLGMYQPKIPDNFNEN